MPQRKIYFMTHDTRRGFLKKGVTLAASVAFASVLPRRSRAADSTSAGVDGRSGRYAPASTPSPNSWTWRWSSATTTSATPTKKSEKYFNYPQVFEYDATGLAPGTIKAPPAPGVHPRVLFHPEDLPALRRRLDETKPGKMQMDGIRAMLTRKTSPAPAPGSAPCTQRRRMGRPTPALLDVECSAAINYECFRCLIDNDAVGGKKAAAALTTLAQLDSTELDKVLRQVRRSAR